MNTSMKFFSAAVSGIAFGIFASVITSNILMLPTVALAVVTFLASLDFIILSKMTR